MGLNLPLLIRAKFEDISGSFLTKLGFLLIVTLSLLLVGFKFS